MQAIGYEFVSESNGVVKNYSSRHFIHAGVRTRVILLLQEITSLQILICVKFGGDDPLSINKKI